MAHYLIAAAAALVFSGCAVAVRLLKKDKLHIFLKIASLIFAAIILVAYLWDADAIASIYNRAPIAGVKTNTVFAFVLVWLTTGSCILLCIYPFFKNKCGALDILLPLPALAFILDAAFLNDFIAAHTGAGISALSARSVLFSIEVGMGLSYSAFCLAVYARELPKYKKQLGWCALALLGILICTLPNYTLQLLLDPARYASLKVDDLNLYHRIFIYPAILLPVAMYFALCSRKLETRRCALLFYALAGLWNYMSTQKFPMIIGLQHVGSWPLHLCNTAVYVTPLCLTFKWKRLFYFTYFINVFGALLALTMPNYSLDNLGGSITMSATFHFYRPHYIAFFMPLLIVALGIFERPKLKQFIWSMVGFFGYYVLVLILNGWFANYDVGIDFFFINSDFIAGKLGSWAEAIYDNFVWKFSIGELTFVYRPLYQLLYFVVYCLLALAMWFVYELAYKSVDGWRELYSRKKKIRMDALALAASKPHDGGAKMNETNATLSIQGFSKRYGRSEVYAAKDVTFEVKGGEIFGFLGPNGAGKSTIIKSIVGIQPITEGNIYVCGYDVEKQSVQSKLNIGFVPDHYALYEKLTAREYVNYIADLYDVPKADRDERMARFVEIFELQKAVDDPISTYSHGMKQKVAIMAALIHNPKLWILDEPLTGLDPNSIFQVKECMKRHAAEGNAVFFSSHLIDVVERICDRIAIIRKGQIQCIRDVKEIESETTLESFYMNIIESKDVKPVPYTEQKA